MVHRVYKAQPGAFSMRRPTSFAYRESRAESSGRVSVGPLFFVSVLAGMPMYNSKPGARMNVCYSNVTTAFGASKAPNRVCVTL